MSNDESPPPFIDENTRLNFQRMMKDNDVQETTQHIRELKHSRLIRQDVNHMMKLKKKYTRLSYEQFRQIATSQCNFIFNNYTNIFNRLLSDELDYNTMHQFLDVLEDIENEKMDQHEGSYKIGMILKNLYIDSALKRESRLNNDGKKVTFKKPVNNISWDKYKLLHLNDDSKKNDDL